MGTYLIGCLTCRLAEEQTIKSTRMATRPPWRIVTEMCWWRPAPPDPVRRMAAAALFEFAATAEATVVPLHSHHRSSTTTYSNKSTFRKTRPIRPNHPSNRAQCRPQLRLRQKPILQRTQLWRRPFWKRYWISCVKPRQRKRWRIQWRPWLHEMDAFCK